jgi:hypothetical protein
VAAPGRYAEANSNKTGRRDDFVQPKQELAAESEAEALAGTRGHPGQRRVFDFTGVCARVRVCVCVCICVCVHGIDNGGAHCPPSPLQ